MTTYKKFLACAKISADDRSFAASNISQLKDVTSVYLHPKSPDEKEMVRKSAVSQCKDGDDMLKKQLAAAGC